MNSSRRSLCLVAALAALPAVAAAQSIVINGQTFPLDTSQPVSVDPATGDISVTTQEQVLCSVGGNPPTITTQLSLNPVSAQETDGPLTVSATYATEGATSCTGSADPGFNIGSNWNSLDLATQSPNGEQTFSVSPTSINPGAYTLQLSCSNASGTTTSTASFSVLSGTAANCVGREPPAGLTIDSSILNNSSAKTFTYASVFGPFPGNSTEKIEIRNDEYAALEFTTDTLTASSVGSIGLGQNTARNVGDMILSFSECPGDFGPNVPDACRRVINPFLNDRIAWAVEPTSPQFQCDLDLNKTYYLNIVPATTLPNDQNPTWSCAGEVGVSNCEATADASGS